MSYHVATLKNNRDELRKNCTVLSGDDSSSQKTEKSRAAKSSKFGGAEIGGFNVKI
ncbi:hypothetical protein [Psychrobacter ciconiae]|uniref:hypothetical protein n=1 Tax=Psychrobacter ciconiae TaxID=1553449 RepID=UPI00191A9E9D|nr:hypothetical protein [Psychrobacter ciconiae]